MNKTIVITGTTSGMGQSLKKKFIQCGDTVISLSKNEPNPTITDLQCDISDEARVIECFQHISSNFGEIDMLINNAGFGLSGATELIPSEEIRSLFDVNYFGALYCIKNAIPLMKKGAKIINISSACALFPLPYRTQYCASKAAISMLSFGLRMELRPSGIDVCAICPGDTKTNFTKNRKKINITNERYGESVVSSANYVDKKEDKRMSVDSVVSKIFKTANKKKLPAQKIIGAKYHFFYICSRIIPVGPFIKILNKIFNKK